MISWWLWMALARAGAPEVDTPLHAALNAGRDAALVVSIADYRFLPDVPHAKADAATMRNIFVGLIGVPGRRVVQVADGSSRQVSRAARRAAHRVRRGGTLWIYFSGHGAVQDGNWKLLGSDAPARPAEAARSGVDMGELGELLASSRAGRVIAIVDAGFGGVGPDGKKVFSGRPAIVDGLPPAGSEKLAWWVATSQGEPAWNWPQAGHGLFTWLVAGAVRGWADGATGHAADGQVTLAEATTWVRRTIRMLGRNQFPVLVAPPIASQWAIVQGRLEAPPSSAELHELALADRARRFADAEARLRAEASAAWEDVQGLVAQGGPEGREALEDFIGAYGRASVLVEWAVVLPELSKARAELADYQVRAGPPAVPQPSPAADTGSTSPPAEAPAAEAPAAEAPAAEAPAAEAPAAEAPAVAELEVAHPPPEGPSPPDDCDDIEALRSFALMGRLGDPLVACIEGRFHSETVQTTRDQLSRLLLADAEARGDEESWGRYAKRHLDDIDRSDPNLCFKYALYLFRQDPVLNGEEIIRWADYALENKHVWSKATYKRRLYDLYRLRTEVANRRWMQAESAYAESPSDELKAQAERWRSSAKVYAREWLDYARASGQASRKPLAICESAAGTPSYCEGS